VLVNIALFLFFLIAASIIGFILYSGNSSTIYDVRLVNGEIEKINMIRHLSLELLSNIFSAVIISTITFLIATITRKSALATVVSFVVFFGGGMISEFFREYWFYKYLITQNFQLSVFITKEWLPYEGATFGTSLFICLAYSFVFFTAGLLIFNKRDVY
jgi:ABC-type transport system involved in multi-copper enzyme maturation permease subunit